MKGTERVKLAEKRIKTIFTEIGHELASAYAKHPPINSPHEAYAVILEELDEYKEWVWMRSSKRDVAEMRAELVQVASMAIRAIIDTIDSTEGR